ncbi:hypothetical protein C7M84_018557 [Penaeus vannamei]|uniref:Uncharacterized protein n=1 Tax=Penaeus vannamei TaxID=6689 RepID=A0A3R7PER8_PENVA|nr:hypothetical protein C7M84_018557 [Penaeus vannamei]
MTRDDPEAFPFDKENITKDPGACVGGRRARDGIARIPGGRSDVGLREEGPKGRSRTATPSACVTALCHDQRGRRGCGGWVGGGLGAPAASLGAVQSTEPRYISRQAGPGCSPPPPLLFPSVSSPSLSPSLPSSSLLLSPLLPLSSPPPFFTPAHLPGSLHLPSFTPFPPSSVPSSTFYLSYSSSLFFFPLSHAPSLPFHPLPIFLLFILFLLLSSLPLFFFVPSLAPTFLVPLFLSSFPPSFLPSSPFLSSSLPSSPSLPFLYLFCTPSSFSLFSPFLCLLFVFLSFIAHPSIRCFSSLPPTILISSSTLSLSFSSYFLPSLASAHSASSPSFAPSFSSFSSFHLLYILFLPSLTTMFSSFSSAYFRGFLFSLLPFFFSSLRLSLPSIYCPGSSFPLPFSLLHSYLPSLAFSPSPLLPSHSPSLSFFPSFLPSFCPSLPPAYFPGSFPPAAGGGRGPSPPPCESGSLSLYKSPLTREDNRPPHSPHGRKSH